VYLVNDPHKALSLGVCEELFIRCNLHRDQAFKSAGDYDSNYETIIPSIVYVMHVA
jgi:hypothetical protein